MKTIYKYTLDNLNFAIYIPAGFKILTLGLQGEDMVMWVEVDDQMPEIPVEVFVVGTGWDMDHMKDTTYFGTVQKGSLVYHGYYYVHPG